MAAVAWVWIPRVWIPPALTVEELIEDHQDGQKRRDRHHDDQKDTDRPLVGRIARGRDDDGAEEPATLGKGGDAYFGKGGDAYLGNRLHPPYCTRRQ